MCVSSIIQAQSQSVTNGLDDKQRAIITISAHTARGEIRSLKTALETGLNAGLSINETKEILVQMYAYCGFPRALNALNTLMAVVEERKESGKTDVGGTEPNLLPSNTNMLEYGENIRTQLVGYPVVGKVYEFCPIIDEYLCSHLFGDIFSRDNINYQYRELATVSALAGMNLENQLRSHLSICKKIGFTKDELQEFTSVISTKIGFTEGETANRVVAAVFSEDNKTNRDMEMKRITFPNRNITVAGNLFLPTDFEENKKYPAIIVGHPAGGVKEQTAGTYARNLAEKGFITLAFDASYQGESGGEPRGVEDPAVRTEDFRCAVDYLSALPYVRNIGVMGICGGGGFAIAAAITDHRIKAVAGVSAVDLGQLRRDGMNGSLNATIQSRLDAAVEQRTIEAKGGEIRYANYVPNSLEEIPANAPKMYREGYEYYRTPLAQHPRSTNKYTFTSLDKLISFTAFDHLELLAPRPLLMIAGSEAESFYYSQDAYDRAREPKELYKVQGASHIELYWKPEYVKEVTNKLNDYFTKYLIQR